MNAPMPRPAADAVRVDPDLLVDMLQGYQQTAALRAAVGLDLASAIAAGAAEIPALAAATSADPRALTILCDYLVVRGVLTREGSRYGLAPVAAAFLDRRSPAYLGSIADFLAAPVIEEMFMADPVGLIRRGGAPGLANMSPDNPVWVTFAEAMAPFFYPLAQGIAQQIAAGPHPRKVLDLAAGHGLFGIAIGQAVPEAQIVALDWGNVIEVARRNAAPLGERWSAIAGDAFSADWGTGYDLILIPNFLHHFDAEANAALLDKAKRALSPAGKVLAVEFVVDESRLGPGYPAIFGWFMLGTTPHGNTLTPSDLASIARRAGFEGASVMPLPPSPQSLVAFY